MISVVGKRNGMLVVLESRKDKKYLVRCDCGNEKVIDARNFYRTISCGCYFEQVKGLSAIKHGFRRGVAQKDPISEYTTWGNMIQRCTNPNTKNYLAYGGRGITVCARWREPDGKGFENFYSDMGPKPTQEHSIDRTNNDGNYEPSNCTWATKKEQASNTRANRFISVNGVAKTLTETSDVAGINIGTLHGRLERGWSENDAINIEPKSRPPLDLSPGTRFHSLEVIRCVGKQGKSKHDHYECRCDCGNTAIIRGTKLTHGDARWCSQQCPVRKEFFKKSRAEEPKEIKMCSWDCGQPAKAKGLCFKHYSHEKRHGNLAASPSSGLKSPPSLGLKSSPI